MARKVRIGNLGIITEREAAAWNEQYKSARIVGYSHDRAIAAAERRVRKLRLGID